MPPWFNDCMSIPAPSEPSVFLATTTDVLKFVNQINSASLCYTDGCKGRLVPSAYFLKGKGGTAKLEFKCSGCNERKIVLNSSSSSNAHGIPDLSLALRVASIAAGCRYATYDKMFRCMAMNTVTSNHFHHTFELLYEPVKELLDEMCEAAKQEMKDMPQSELGSWSRAVTAGDGVWLTRGHHSQNATFTVRNYITGAVLYYEHMCQRGNDSVTEEQLFEGTSKAAEAYGADSAFKRASEEGMKIEAHWQDGDSTSADVLHKHFKDAKIFLCSGHVAKNHAKRLTNEYSTRDVNGVRCHCVNDRGRLVHKVQPGNYCGCFNDAFVKRAKRNLVQILNNVGTDVVKFQQDIRNLAKYHACNVHEWTEYDPMTNGVIKRQCNFHPLRVCSCDGKCPADSLQCSGKPYRPHIVLTCPLHTMLYQQECHRLSNLAPTVIHPVLGKGSTNVVEMSHSVLTRFRAKDWNIEKLHYTVSTDMGLIQTNMPWCYETCGPEYHWITDLYERMNIPIFGDLPEVMKRCNEKRDKLSTYKKSEEAKKKGQKH